MWEKRTTTRARARHFVHVRNCISFRYKYFISLTRYATRCMLSLSLWFQNALCMKTRKRNYALLLWRACLACVMQWEEVDTFMTRRNCTKWINFTKSITKVVKGSSALRATKERERKKGGRECSVGEPMMESSQARATTEGASQKEKEKVGKAKKMYERGCGRRMNPWWGHHTCG